MDANIYGHIYLITNIVNGKVYVGQTVLSQKEKINEYRSSASRKRKDRPIILAMNKYGFDSFIFEFIDSAYSQSELDEKERLYIASHDSTRKKIGYNVETGGIRGKTTSNEVRGKLSQIMKEKYASGQMTPPMLGKTLSLEARQKISDAQKRRPPQIITELTRQKQSAVRKGWCSNPKCYRPVLCVETGERFMTIREAAKAIGLSFRAAANIGSAAKGRIKTAYGHTWKYLTESPWTNNDIQQLTLQGT
jgi:group I intron endonuclease